MSLLAVTPLAVMTHILSHVDGACRLSADDAMGAGIDFLLLIGIAAVFLVVIAIVSVVHSTRGRKKVSG